MEVVYYRKSTTDGYWRSIYSPNRLYFRTTNDFPDVFMVFLLVFWCLPPCRILASCTDLMQAIKELVLSSKHLQRDIVESGRVSNDSDSTTRIHNALLGTKASFY